MHADIAPSILSLIHTLARKSDLTAPVKQVVLYHLLAYMRCSGLVDDNGVAVTVDEAAACNLLSSVVSSTPKVSYDSVSAFVPVLRGILMSYEWSLEKTSHIVLSALFVLFSCGSGSNEGCWRSDLLDFAASSEFVTLLDFADAEKLMLLQKFVEIFDDEMFTCAFPEHRFEFILSSFEASQMCALAHLEAFMSVLAPLTVRFPVFVCRLSRDPNFVRIIGTINEKINEIPLMCFESLLDNTTLVFECMLNAATDVAHEAQQLLAAGAMKICCTVLKHFVVSNRLDNMEHLALLLRVLRVMISASISTNASDTSPGPAVRGSGDAPPNPSVAEFIACRGLQIVKLLHYEEDMQEDGGSPAQHEFMQFYALLADLRLIAPITDATKEARRQTLAETSVFIGAHDSWQTAFNAYIASRLTKSGYPRYGADNGQMESNRAPPSAATLTFLQARARECVLCDARGELKDVNMTSDVVFSMRFSRSQAQQRDMYIMVIRPDDEAFPCNAAYFRVAANNHGLGKRLHTCFLPPGLSSAASLPFFALSLDDCSCPN